MLKTKHDKTHWISKQNDKQIKKTEKLPTKINNKSQKFIKNKQKGLSVSSYARFLI